MIGLSLTEDVVDTALITRLTPLFSAAAISADNEERSDRPPVESGLAVMSSSAAHAPVSQASVLASRLDTAETSCASCDCDSRSSSADTVPSRCSVLGTQTQLSVCARAQSHTHSDPVTYTQNHTPAVRPRVLCSDATHSSSLTVETALYPPPPLWPPPPSHGRQSSAPVHQAIALSPAEPRWRGGLRLCVQGEHHGPAVLIEAEFELHRTTVLQHRESTCA